jgi:hypothetical protein
MVYLAHKDKILYIMVILIIDYEITKYKNYNISNCSICFNK